MNSSRKEKIFVLTTLFLSMILFFCIGLLIAKVIFNAELSFKYVLISFLSCVSYYIGYFGVLALLSGRSARFK